MSAESTLPQGWTFAKLDELTNSVSTTGKKVKTKDARPTGRYPVIDQGAAACSGYMDDDTSVVSASPAKPVILFGDHTRIVKFIVQPFIPGADGTKLLQSKQSISPRYLHHLLNAAEVPDRGYGRHFSHLRALNLPLAPQPEQQRIADKLDTVLARVDAVNDSLARVAPLLKSFRQSVLAAATSGRLTASGESESTSNTNWPVITVGSACRLQNGYAFKSEIFKSSGDFQVVKLANVKDGQLKLDSSPAYVDACDIGSPFALQPNAGDILISMTGTRHKRDYGYVCAVPDGVRILVNQRVGRLSPDISRVSGKFLLLSLMSSEFRDQFFSGETGGVNQGNVGSEHIKSCTFRCPPLQEQTEIVRRVELLFAFAGRLEVRLQAAQTASARLTPALLAKAFRGELVPQDPNDEPASELLRRLSENHEKVTASHTPKRRKLSAPSA